MEFFKLSLYLLGSTKGGSRREQIGEGPKYQAKVHYKRK